MVDPLLETEGSSDCKDTSSLQPAWGGKAEREASWVIHDFWT